MDFKNLDINAEVELVLENGAKYNGILFFENEGEESSTVCIEHDYFFKDGDEDSGVIEACMRTFFDSSQIVSISQYHKYKKP